MINALHNNSKSIAVRWLHITRYCVIADYCTDGHIDIYSWINSTAKNSDTSEISGVYNCVRTAHVIPAHHNASWSKGGAGAIGVLNLDPEASIINKNIG